MSETSLHPKLVQYNKLKDPLAGIFAVGARFVDTGHLGYVPNESSVTVRSADAVTVDFGPVYNPSGEDTVAILEV